jgi:hypothetical protein
MQWVLHRKAKLAMGNLTGDQVSWLIGPCVQPSPPYGG